MNLISRIKGKIDYWKRGVAMFAKINYSNDLFLENLSAIRYKEFTQVELLKDYDFVEEKLLDYRKRFSKGEILCVLEKDIQIIVSGWVNPNPLHSIGELALLINDQGKFEVLYDFETKEAYRGQGLYPFLLNEIVKRNQKSKVIYALLDNISSIKGIKKAGFKHLGNIYGINKNKAKNLLQRI